MSQYQIKHKEIIRPTLFYGRYVHKIAFSMSYASVVNFSYSDSDISEYVKNDCDYRIRGSTPSEAAALNDLLSFLMRHNPERRGTPETLISLWRFEVRVFTNSEDVIKELLTFANGLVRHATINNAGLEPDEMIFVSDPPHALRTYLRRGRVDNLWKSDFANFLETHPDIKPCPALKRCLEVKNDMVGASYHVGYDLPQSRMILQLFLDSSYVGKHFRCIKRP